MHCFSGILVIQALFMLLLDLPVSSSHVSTESCRALLRRSITAFFYLWYGVPAHDNGRYLHWDHSVLPHWTSTTNEKFEAMINKHHNPEMGDIHAPFFPARGLYSSRDPHVLRHQFREMHDAGITLVALSWWGRPSPMAADSQGVNTDDALPIVLAAAEEVRQEKGRDDLYITMHLEPYPGRTISAIKDDLAYIYEHYAHFSAFLPIFYVYDSYHIPPEEWALLLQPWGKESVRDTPLDGLFIGLWLERDHGQALVDGGFDGMYTYFASVSFSFGSTLANWDDMAAFCRRQGELEGKGEEKQVGKRGFLSVLSVGPGYDDEKIRPWNKHNTKPREGLDYMDRMLEAAREARPDAISITSYNEWGEGTQIEAAKVGEWRCEGNWEGNSTHLAVRPYVYQEYKGGDPYLYLNNVKLWRELLWNMTATEDEQTINDKDEF
jgi:glycoprotein endo-alpha-1,2-mannosidase